MIKKILQAIGFGLFCATLIVFVAPYVNNQLALNKASSIVSYHNAVKIAAPAVVNVYNQSFDLASGNNGLQISNLGSGVIMTASGYILTNKHVVEDADQILVALQSREVFSAKLVGSDALTDLAVLKIEAKNLPFIPQNAKRPIRVGDVVLAIGNPFNLGQSITQGIVSGIERNALSEGRRQNFIQIDASINKGNSGGALINTAGELIGINTLSLGKNTIDIAEGLNFAIPITLANKIMTKIIRDGRVIRGYFGVGTELFYSAKQLGVAERGVVVTSVFENGPAARGGVEPNDIILRIGHIEAEFPRQMMEEIAEIKPGTKVDVLVLRQGKEKLLQVTIGEFPES
ncbi:outer membrane-stress sensor serine endopeptidase DegS [Pasteurella atlantica]|uniref:outer membrane-stress sensor serine endopeptidase DegS n=1 Tax=Pasteurellaceae TaxID=712 RepID=UPI0027770163|nr:outer membrane-stress sensor serine endopeptidase DegS [Pasteurella atlantica]MDP8098275.1 outer membrane-stress sensor serine endopeptidase DegS [Pasteurella atlantica]MDP8106553.1 outer membrane-stress sensor serine endopeptidase DegS [Pasteurella atlantica]MDP8116078.1 outer membrane-stress sensor serine endopeptidase DegS [Pasteurella atlantica]